MCFFVIFNWVIKMDKIIEWIKDNLRIVIVIVVVVGYLGYKQMNKTKIPTNNEVLTTKTNNKEEAKKDKKEPKFVVVDVQGAVKKPGIYRMPNSARIYDAIQHAGGTKDAADMSKINQAQKVHDQSQVFVADKSTDGNKTDNAGKAADTGSNNSQQININSADVTELQKINGIGARKAETIVKYRDDNGSFDKVEDLTKVNGIGDKTVERIKDQITV